MKNKKALYVLLPTVISIWGYLFYKIFSTLNQDEPVANYSASGAAISLNENSPFNTFNLLANYRDPFLGKMVLDNKRAVQSNNPAPANPAIKKPVQQTQWPQISYTGMIKNQQSKKQLAMVQINGKDYSLKIGEETDGIELKKIFKDSIEVSKGKEKKIIRK